MVFAACWGVVQLAVLGSAARTVRAGTLLLAVGAGVYGCGVLAVVVEYAWTHLRADATGVPIYQVVATASYTVDPFVEEIAKVVPLVLLAWGARARWQRGLTDYLLLGAATGAGFGLAEAVMRFGTRAGTAIGMPDGWVLPISLSPPTIPTPGAVVVSWLPAPAGGDGFLSLSAGSGTNLHLAWSALAGLGVGFAVRGRGPVRLLGPGLVLLVGADHAAYNFDARHPGDNGLGGHLVAPLVAAQPLLWLWPLLALAAAVALDVYWLRRARGVAPDLRLRRERGATAPAPASVQLARYAVLGLPWTPLVIARFALLRRAALYQVGPGRRSGPEAGPPTVPSPDVGSSAVPSSVPVGAGPLLAEVAGIRDQLDAADSATAWRRVGRLAPGGSRTEGGRRSWLRRWWPLLVWAVLLVPALVYYGLGSTPAAAGIQKTLAGRLPFLLVLAAPAVLGCGLLVWQLAVLVRTLPAVLRAPAAEVAARVQLRIATGLGSLVLAAATVWAWARGTRASSTLLSGVHVLDALSMLLLVAGVALLVAAFVFFPPSIGLAAVVTTTGLEILVPTIAVSGAFATTAGLGAMGIVLSQAADNASGTGGTSGGGGGDSVPDLPQQPPRPRPQVRDWKLRRIVDNLWKGTDNPNHVGDGTTMDAVRNELRTGRPTEGRFHTEKAQTELNALERWIKRYGPTASREDTKWAWRLKNELQQLLGGK